MITRREALTSFVLGSGAAFLPSSALGKGAPQSNGSRFLYSLNTSTISGKSPGILSYIEIASKAGYDLIEVWIRDVKAYLDAGNRLSSLRKFIDDQGIAVANAIGFAPWMTGGKDGFLQMESEMDLLAEIGCPRIAAPPAGVHPGETLDYFKIGEKYSKLIELGRKKGVMPQLEFWGSSNVLWHIGQALLIASAADEADVKILPDIFHMFKGNSGFETLKMLNGNCIDIFHINDYPETKTRLEQNDSDRIYPGDGVAPILDILTDLKNMGGDKILSLELFNRNYWEDDPLHVAKTGLNKMRDLAGKLSKL